MNSYLTESPRYLSFYPNEHYSITNLVSGFLLILLIGVNLAIFIGGILAITFSEFSSLRFINRSRSVIELFTNVPYVVYGYLLLLMFNEFIDLTSGFNNLIVSGLVLGGMMLPTISNKFIRVFQSVPYDQREGAYSMGATPYKTALMVLVPSQRKLFISSIIVTIVRTFCEILIVLLVAGFIIDKIAVIISIFMVAIIGTWTSQLLKKSHYKSEAL
ncbi:MAG: phosphate transport system permease protein [Saprospiraceae bacterium]